MPPASRLSSLLVFLAWPCALADAGRARRHQACNEDCRTHDDAVSLIQAAKHAAVRGAASLRFDDREEVSVSDSLETMSNHSSNASASLSSNATGTPTVCVWPRDLDNTLEQTLSTVLEGLPPWPTEDNVPASVSRVSLAFLIQVSYKERISMLRRVFNLLYSPYDVYLYLADAATLDLETVSAALPQPLPSNVGVVMSPHAGYYFWPRVQVLLNGMKSLLNSQWDFVVHLSESDYPLHSLHWIRATLAAQRRHVFLKIHPRCQLDENRTLVRSEWYWWSQISAVASCEGAFTPKLVPGVRFPMQEMEEQGFVFASAAEWNILPRELVQYAMQPELDSFKRLVGMHIASDELFWATLVLNIPNFQWTLNPQSWFMYRSPTNDGHSPDTLVPNHMQRILQARPANFFLRKVDAGHSQALLDMLDQVISEPDVQPGPGRSPWEPRQNAVSCSWRPVDTSGPYAYWTPPPEPEAQGPFAAPAPPADSWLR